MIGRSKFTKLSGISPSGDILGDLLGSQQRGPDSCIGILVQEFSRDWISSLGNAIFVRRFSNRRMEVVRKVVQETTYRRLDEVRCRTSSTKHAVTELVRLGLEYALHGRDCARDLQGRRTGALDRQARQGEKSRGAQLPCHST
jgi:hypothetical protein